MATINQLKKQLETANKNLAKYESKVVMYSERLAKNLAKATKVVDFEVTEENHEAISRSHFDLYCSISNAIDYREDNKKNAEYERRNIARLQKELDTLVAEADAKATSDKPLEMALRSAMSEFRVIWFERMLNWHESSYYIVRNAFANAEKRYTRAKYAQNYFQRNHGWNECRKIKAYLKNEIEENAKIMMHRANRMSFDDYMEYIKAELNASWESGIAKLVDKCRKYCLNEAKIKAHAPSVTEKGFDVVLTDGSNRYINARVIWAAEYSELVTPHTRYIVTEKNN